MRRKDRAITDRTEIEAIIRGSRVCRLAMCDGGTPYVVPLFFGLRDDTLYFHCAKEGHIIRRNPRVCFEFDTDIEIIPHETACSWASNYRSVIGFGTAEIVEDPSEVKAALDAIMSNYTDRLAEYSETALASIAVIRVRIEEMTGKKSGC